MIEELYKYDRLWVGYVKDNGCNLETAKDIVQEFYIKMHVCKSDYLYENNKPNFYGCYLILRNMVIDLKRKEKNFSLISDENIPELEGEKYTEDSSIDNKYYALNKWIDDNTLNIENGKVDYTQESLKKLYLRTIYDAVFETGKSMTQLSKETGIKYDTIRYAVAVIKKQIKNIYEQ
jgi:DNA-directed RNA polymerase specialized sigma24 family protein